MLSGVIFQTAGPLSRLRRKHRESALQPELDLFGVVVGKNADLVFALDCDPGPDLEGP